MKCPYCGLTHETVCPKVKSIEYDETGLIVRRVEFFAPNDYPPMQLSGYTPAHSRGDDFAEWVRESW